MKVLKGGHKLMTLFHFVPLVWIVAIIAVVTDVVITELLS
jgi:archaellum biogenesis protein FlaJ (TadC family)